jgi:magnesium transporter
LQKVWKSESFSGKNRSYRSLDIICTRIMLIKTLDEIRKILEQQKDFLRDKYKVKEISIFGSFVRGEQKKTSDVDILVEFYETPDLLTFLELERFLEELPGAVTKRLIQMLSPDERKIATKLLGYPEDSIGRLMTPEFIAVEPHFTIAETLDYIRSHCQDSETLNIVYVIDKDLHLLDDIPIRKIILAGPEQKIGEIMDNRVTALNVLDDQEEAIAIFKDTNMVALPVVDSDLVLLGIVTVDDVMDLVEEETTEDFHKFGAVQDAVLNPMKARIYTLYKQRVFWLTTLVFMNIFSGAAIAHFGDVIQKSVSLLYFLPLLIGSGGNAGAQSATLMIRSLAIGDVGTKDWLKLLSKEFSVSLLLGLTMAAGVSVIASFRAPNILFVVSITMVCTVITGSLIGMLLPFIFTKLKLDPATASAPLITSLADISGVIIYFTFATFLLGL